MKATINSLDIGPNDLTDILPLDMEYIKDLPGNDGVDYKVFKLDKSYKLQVDKGTVAVNVPDEYKEISYVVLNPHLEGYAIKPETKDLGLRISYVIDESLLNDNEMAFEKVDYVAIGFCDTH